MKIKKHAIVLEEPDLTQLEVIHHDGDEHAAVQFVR